MKVQGEAGRPSLCRNGAPTLETVLADLRGSGLSVQAAATYMASEVPGLVAEDAASAADRSRREGEAMLEEAFMARHVTSLIRQAELASGRRPLTLIDALRLLAERGNEDAQSILAHPE